MIIKKKEIKNKHTRCGDKRMAQRCTRRSLSNYTGTDHISWINTHYIHSVVVQYVVSGRACCVNQYHYESIKTDFKQITRAELKCAQYSQGDYILCMTSRYSVMAAYTTTGHSKYSYFKLCILMLIKVFLFNN
jgi:hypothetical protein